MPFVEYDDVVEDIPTTVADELFGEKMTGVPITAPGHPAKEFLAWWNFSPFHRITSREGLE